MFLSLSFVSSSLSMLCISLPVNQSCYQSFHIDVLECICPFVCLSTHLSGYPWRCLSVCLSIVRPSVLSLCPSIDVSVFLFVSVGPSSLMMSIRSLHICPSIHPLISCHFSVCLSLIFPQLFVCTFVQTSGILSVWSEIQSEAVSLQ